MPLRVLKLSDLRAEERRRIVSREAVGDPALEEEGAEIIKAVKARGDEEIIDFYERLFGRGVVTRENLRVSEEEFDEAYGRISDQLIEALKFAAKRIEEVHRKQLPPKISLYEVDEGVYVGQVTKPIESVGIYVPSGGAAYPSTALMAAIPARVAGVRRLIACTPPSGDGSVNPATLVALDIAGVREVYRVGGAHAAAAMAFGTESIPKVVKIVGPGGVWFTIAKKLLMGDVSIDMIAGPSECLIIADDSAKPEFVAWDLIAQAEHDPAASAILVTTSERLARETSRLVEEFVKSSPRREVIEKSLERNGAILIAEDLDEAFEFANEYSAEHVEVIASIPLTEILSRLENAGSISIGQHTPIALGDYVVGSNHILPTGGWARARGGLTVLDYLKTITFQICSELGLERLGRYAMRIAEAENLHAHAQSIRVRLGEDRIPVLRS